VTISTLIQTTGVDWAQHWQDLVRSRRNFLVPPERATLQGNAWDERAGRFARLADELDADADPLVAAVAENLRAEPGSTLLDIGAGAGRYTFSLAGAARSVTAVEPSPGMCSALRAGLARRAIPNVSVVNDSWQDAHVPQHDVALVAHVVYFVEDVVPFVEKLNRSARRACFVAIRVEEMASALAPLWVEIRGSECPREPGFLDFYNLLFSMGIHANARVAQFGTRGRFTTIEDAVEFTRDRLGLKPDQTDRNAKIREFLEETLVSRDGGLAWPSNPDTAIVWWEV
jgi:protein-L-isoaspartate O-methyltransferase